MKHANWCFEFRVQLVDFRTGVQKISLSNAEFSNVSRGNQNEKELPYHCLLFLAFFASEKERKFLGPAR